jgi:probable F420-dependent oxidoreductase
VNPTDAPSVLRRPGVWFFTDGLAAPEAAEFAERIESLGYSALWLPETVGRDPFAHLAHLAHHTSSLILATGIANIFHRHPGPMRQAAMTLAEQTGSRFVLGLGVSHAPLVEGLRKLDYSRPLAQMRHYLEAMDASPYRGPPPSELPLRLLGALGPRMLELAGELADGVHPYFTTPEHTARAREILGPDKLVCVEQKVVLETDADRAREVACKAIGMYAGLPNYRNNWIRLGFSDEEIERRDHRFVDAVVAWGDEEALRARVEAHYEAGATHVCVQPLGQGPRGAVDWRVLEALAPASA